MAHPPQQDPNQPQPGQFGRPPEYESSPPPGQQPHGAPQYAQPQYGPPPTSGGGNRGLIIGLSIGGAVLLVAGVLAIVLVFGSSDEGSDEAEAAVDDLYTALQNGDVDTARAVTCADMQQITGLDQATPEYVANLQAEFAGISWEIADSEQDGDSTTVMVEFTDPGRPENEVFNSRREVNVDRIDGDWKVCDMTGA